MSEQTLPSAGDVYRHKSGVEYRVLDIVQTEVAVNAYTFEWVAAVEYTHTTDNKGVKYVRTMRRFLNRFDFVRRE